METNEMISQVDVLRTLMKLGGRGQGDSTGIVQVDGDGRNKRHPKLKEQGAKPKTLLHNVRGGNVLGLGRGESNRGLLLGYVRNQATRIEPGITRNRATAQLIGPTGVSISEQAGVISHQLVALTDVNGPRQIT